MARRVSIVALFALAACAAQTASPSDTYDHQRERDVLTGKSDDPAPLKE